MVVILLFMVVIKQPAVVFIRIGGEFFLENCCDKALVEYLACVALM